MQIDNQRRNGRAAVAFETYTVSIVGDLDCRLDLLAYGYKPGQIITQRKVHVSHHQHMLDYTCNNKCILFY